MCDACERTSPLTDTDHVSPLQLLRRPPTLLRRAGIGGVGRGRARHPAARRLRRRGRPAVRVRPARRGPARRRSSRRWPRPPCRPPPPRPRSGPAAPADLRADDRHPGRVGRRRVDRAPPSGASRRSASSSSTTPPAPTTRRTRAGDAGHVPLPRRRPGLLRRRVQLRHRPPGHRLRGPVGAALRARARRHDGEDGGGYGVVGAHALGVNAGSCGIVLIGDFTKAQADHGRARPASSSSSPGRRRSTRSTRSAPRSTSRSSALHRTFPNIAGHRQTGQTVCPGRGLFNQLAVDPRPGGRPHRAVPGDDHRHVEGPALDRGQRARRPARPQRGRRSPRRPRRRQPAGAKLTGYRLLTTDGRVVTLGKAATLGSPRDAGLAAVTAIAGVPGRNAYLTADPTGTGRRLRRRGERHAEPAGPAPPTWRRPPVARATGC